MNNYKNIFIFLGVLVIVFIIILFLKSENLEEKQISQVVEKTCEEKCQTENCLYGCYSVTINIAIAEKNIARCNEIKSSNTEQRCKDEVNFALKNCDKILDEELRSACLG